MRRFITLLTILALGLLVACGGGDDDPKDSDGSSSSDSGSSSSSSSSGGSKDNFCTPEYADAVFDDFDPLSGADDLEDAIKEMNSLLDRWADDAPSEIRSDVRIIVDAMGGFFEILEENDYDFMAMAFAAEDDPRLAALDSPEFVAASNRLDEYCGYDIESAVDTGSSSDSGSATAVSGSDSAAGGFTQGSLPEDFPEALIPPDSTIGFAGDFGVGSAVEFTSTATLNEVIEFYKNELGDPLISSSEGTLWSVIDGPNAGGVTISGSDGDVEIVVTTVTP